MTAAYALKIRIESALERRIPGALTPVPRLLRPVLPTGIHSVDELVGGGLPLGAITEVSGPECSGRTSIALSFVAGIVAEQRVCAWIDVSDALSVESAIQAGIDSRRLLWVRCGVVDRADKPGTQARFTLSEKYFVPPPAKRGLHGGGFGMHPRGEEKGLSEAVNGLLQQESMSSFSMFKRGPVAIPTECSAPPRTTRRAGALPFSRIDQALRVTDLLLHTGGFAAIVVDMGGIAPEHATRVPTATWFRYRAAAERTQASVLLLTQHPCAKSSAELVLRMETGQPLQDETTLFTGIQHEARILRNRFVQQSGAVPPRKPPQSERGSAIWQSRTTWAGA